MTITMLLPDITNALADLVVDGVTIKDVDRIAASWTSQPNVLYPNPEGFLTNFAPTYQSFTRGTNAQVDLSYSLNYRFLATQVGDLGNFPKAYSGMVTKTLAIIGKMIETTAPFSGRVDMEVGQVTFGARLDPSGNMFHGADIELKITEMQNT